MKTTFYPTLLDEKLHPPYPFVPSRVGQVQPELNDSFRTFVPNFCFSMSDKVVICIRIPLINNVR